MLAEELIEWGRQDNGVVKENATDGGVAYKITNAEKHVKIPFIIETECPSDAGPNI